MTRAVLDIAARSGLKRLLQQVGETIEIDAAPEILDRYEAAVDLAGALRIEIWTLYDELERLYGGDDIPTVHLADLARQLAEQTGRYEVREESAEWTFALVKRGGFAKATEPGGQEVYIADITYPKDREDLVLYADRVVRENVAGFGFHYDPYNFDSTPELEFFQQILRELNTHPAEVEDIYFTGGLTDPAKTDLWVPYVGEDGRLHRYTPDFVIRKRPPAGGRPGTGRVLIVELKQARFEAQTREDLRRSEQGHPPVTNEGRKAAALKTLERSNPERLRYESLFVTSGVTHDQLAGVRRFIREPESAYGGDLEVAHRLRDRILQVDGKRVSKIILFGSRARGDARPDSDYDLLVIVRRIVPGEKRAYRLALYDALRGTGVVAEPWVMSEEEFEETKGVIGGLAQPAWTEGVVLHENA